VGSSSTIDCAPGGASCSSVASCTLGFTPRRGSLPPGLVAHSPGPHRPEFSGSGEWRKSARRIQSLLRSACVTHPKLSSLCSALVGFPVVTGAVTDFAVDIDVGQKVHLNRDGAVSGAVLAPATLHIEAKPARLVTSHLCFCDFGKKGANFIEHTRVGCRVTPGCPADGRLVNMDNLVELINTGDARVEPWNMAGTVQSVG